MTLPADPILTFMMIIGGLVLLLSLWLFVRTLGILGGHRAVGEIVDHEARGRDETGDPYWHPVVRFSEPMSGPVTFTSVTGRDVKSPPVGTKVRVAYRADDPTRAEIVDKGRIWIAPVGTLVFAGLLIGLALWKDGQL